jgi:hypothetical protein
MKVCTSCHSQVEPGWEYCHTCGVTATSPVYAVRDPFDQVVVGPVDAGSAFTALLEGRPTAPHGQVFHDGQAHPGAAPAPVAEVITAPTAPTPVSPAPALAAHVLPTHRALPAGVQRVASALVVLALLALGTLLLATRSELVQTRERLATTQDELDSARGGAAAQ